MPTTKIPYLVVNNFPQLGLLTSLRFLEWASENPDGVISLPTGRTPEFFIKWTAFLLKNWDKNEIRKVREKFGLTLAAKPDLSALHFVQIDEYYPIPSHQLNSYFHYVSNYYIKEFGLDPKKALLINSDEILMAGGRHFLEVFPNYEIDLSLRYRESRSKTEEIQQKSIFLIDEWCCSYEQAIIDKGGIGFFLGGIGPDGHIAFNARGSDLRSTTRLTATNYETQAAAAGDLGGIEVSAKRLVITIGLESNTRNPNATAIVIAAGDTKAKIVKDSLESPISILYPASVLQKLPNARFYLTAGAASKLTDSVDRYFLNNSWTHEKTEKAVINLCKKVEKYGHNLTLEDFENDRHAKLIPGKENPEKIVQSVVESIANKMHRGIKKEENQVFLHTGPHHDDITIGLLPFIGNHVRVPSNTFNFAVLTSGFTAVTNKFVIDLLEETKALIAKGQIQMLNYPDFFTYGYKLKMDKDVNHYLNQIASKQISKQRRGICHRLVRSLVIIYGVDSVAKLIETIDNVLTRLKNSYDGEKNPADIQTLKGMLREFEEELVWAHYGVQVKDVKHLRLGFFQGDMFTEQPEEERDVIPILNLLREIKPTVISLIFDPEGMGHDIHYKVLQAIAAALRLWKDEADLSNLRIWGYRNVYIRFNPEESNIIFPVSLNGMAAMDSAFTNCYSSQAAASFPSHEHNGKLSELSQKIWVEQFDDIRLLLGKDYFYMNSHPKIRATHGLIYLREMKLDEFLNCAKELKENTEWYALQQE
ncbi:MAG TPA: glucosamine-6-phosphate isomerase [Bacteroidales bacterium]|nr:glucosamine-6-phosphate isomerase [Bacteroidales bacterium]